MCLVHYVLFCMFPTKMPDCLMNPRSLSECLNPAPPPAAAAGTPLEVLPGFDADAGTSWVYPVNYPVRQYQYNIVRTAIFENTLVSLPTGQSLIELWLTVIWPPLNRGFMFESRVRKVAHFPIFMNLELLFCNFFLL